MITQIKMINWKSHLDSTLNFSLGTNVFTGSLGCGKSSILDAISFGLFGTFPNLQSKKVKLDDLIMSRPYAKNESNVIINFVIDDKEYSVMRVIERGKGTTYCEIKEEEKLLEAPNTQRVNDMIEKVLKVDYELFCRSIYSEQNGLDYFLRLSKGERMKKIDNMLMIDKFEKARSSAVSLKNKIVDRKLGKQSVISLVDIKDIENKISDIKKNLKESIENRSFLSSDYEFHTKKCKEWGEKLHGLEELDKKLNELKQNKKSLEATKEENQRSVFEIRKTLKDVNVNEIKSKLAELQSKLEEVDKFLNEKTNNLNKYTGLVSEYRIKIHYLERDKSKKKEELDKKQVLKNELEEIKKLYGDNPRILFEQERNKINEIDERIIQINSSLNQLNELILKVEELKDECPICNSKIDTDKKQHLIEERQKTVDNLNKELDEKRKIKTDVLNRLNSSERALNTYNKILLELESFETLVKESSEIELSLPDLVSKKEDIEKKMEEIKLQANELQILSKNIKNEMKEYEILFSRISELQERENKIHELSSLLNTLESQMIVVYNGIGKDNVIDTRRKYEELIIKQSELKEKISSSNQLIFEKEKRLEELENELNSARKYYDEIAKLDKLISDISIFERALEKTQVRLREEFIGTVNYTMNQIWPDVYPYTDFSDIRLNIEEGDYVLQLRDRSGKWIDVDGIASGGERSISSLVLRIAFSLILAPQLKWLILDEPTHNLDMKAVEDLSETLRNKIGDYIQQVFIITHDKTLEGAVTGELYRLNRDKMLGGSTTVERVTMI